MACRSGRDSSGPVVICLFQNSARSHLDGPWLPDQQHGGENELTKFINNMFLLKVHCHFISPSKKFGYFPFIAETSRLLQGMST